MKRIVILAVSCIALFGYGQEDKSQKLAQKKANNYVYEGNTLAEEDFVAAEMEYRKALSEESNNIAGMYNLGHSYYKNGNFEEALYRHQQTAKLSSSKTEKHKAFHNIGNILMQNKKCKEAVEAYKSALRNDPSDDETRYNLALAKKCAEEQKNNPQDKDDKNKDENKDQNKDNQDQEQKDKKDESDKDKGDEDKKEQDKKNDEEEGKDGKNDEEKDSEENKDDKSEGDENDKNKEEDKQNDKDGASDPEKKKSEQKPRPQQLSPQQIKSLLEAMNNQEKRVQEKMNAEKKKEKGGKIKVEKDW